MGLRIEPPPQITEFNHIWRRWIYGLYQSLKEQEEWLAPALENGWVNFGAPFSSAGYMLDSMGFVHLRGVIRTGTFAAAAFTLPAGYQPESDKVFSTSSNNSFGSLTVTLAGAVVPQVGSDTSFSLDGIIFKTA